MGGGTVPLAISGSLDRRQLRWLPLAFWPTHSEVTVCQTGEQLPGRGSPVQIHRQGAPMSQDMIARGVTY